MPLSVTSRTIITEALAAMRPFRRDTWQLAGHYGAVPYHCRGEGRRVSGLLSRYQADRMAGIVAYTVTVKGIPVAWIRGNGRREMPVAPRGAWVALVSGALAPDVSLLNAQRDGEAEELRRLREAQQAAYAAQAAARIAAEREQERRWEEQRLAGQAAYERRVESLGANGSNVCNCVDCCRLYLEEEEARSYLEEEARQNLDSPSRRQRVSDYALSTMDYGGSAREAPPVVAPPAPTLTTWTAFAMETAPVVIPAVSVRETYLVYDTVSGEEREVGGDGLTF